MSRLALVEDLLSRALEDVRANLASAVECCTSMGALDLAPIPGTCLPEAIDQFREGIALVRDIEAAIGRFEEHPEPQWFDDLIDGKWELQAAGETPPPSPSAPPPPLEGVEDGGADDPINLQGSGPAPIEPREG